MGFPCDGHPASTFPRTSAPKDRKGVAASQSLPPGSRGATNVQPTARAPAISTAATNPRKRPLTGSGVGTRGCSAIVLSFPLRRCGNDVMGHKTGHGKPASHEVHVTEHYE